MIKAIKLLPLFLCLSWQVPAQGVSKSLWIKGMSNKLPAMFCESEQYFRQCYQVTATKCEEVATSITRTCLNKFSSRMPAQFTTREEGERWGRIVGECAGEGYGRILRKEFINTQKCNDPRAWIR